MNGKTLSSGSLATYPLRLPISTESRIAAFTVGARILASLIPRYKDVVKVRPGESAITRQQRICDFENDVSFREWIGRTMPHDAEEIFDVTVTRSTGSVDQISAGAGIGYFSLVLGIGAGLNRGVVGGPSTLTETIAARAGDRVQLGAEVVEVVPKTDSVVVRYRQHGRDHEVEARTVVMATTATVTNRVTRDLPEDLRAALGQIRYGNHVVTSVLTEETTPKRCDGIYCIAAPAAGIHVHGVLAGGEGRGTHRQATLLRGTDRIKLAGDYLGTMYTETSIATGFQAAQDAMSLVGTERQHASAAKTASLEIV